MSTSIVWRRTRNRCEACHGYEFCSGCAGAGQIEMVEAQCLVSALCRAWGLEFCWKCQREYTGLQGQRSCPDCGLYPGPF